MFKWMKDKFNKIVGSEEVEETKEEMKETVDEVSETVKEKTEDIKEKSKEKIDDTSETIEEQTENLKDIAKGKKESTEEKINEVKEAVEEDIEEVSETVKEKREEVEDKVEEAKDKVKEKESEVKEEAEEKIEDISETVKKKREEAEDKVKEAKDKVKEKESEVKEEAEEEIEDISETVKKKREEAQDKVEEAKDKVKEKESKVKEEAEEEIEDISETVEDKVEEIEDSEKKLGFFDKLKKGLAKTRDNFTNQIDDILKSYQKIDEELFEDLEEVLITADVGIETTMNLIDNLRDTVKEEKVNDPQEVMGLLKQEIINMMDESIEDNELNLEPLPAVVLVVGVNGVGKTTTIGKMAHSFKQDGKKVLIAAGDTFRAAAIEQLEEWGNRANVDIISHSEGADPAAVIYDGVQAAKARKTDILICDTAGRLHNKSNLMQELNKIFRVLDKEYPEATKEILLVLDATTGQNAMSQAKEFKDVANITGIALTKLDGTAKGGVVLALQSELNIPVKLIGVGEGIDDLQPFNTKDFIEAIFEKN